MALAQPPHILKFGPAIPQFPIILSVPHAGRQYPATLHALARPPLRNLQALEDRYADLLVETAVAMGFTALVATIPRAWIDLNRAEDDLDPHMFEPAALTGKPLSAKARGGLGLIPAHTPTVGKIWKGRIPHAEIEARLQSCHRPYHEALSRELCAAKARFGATMLLDVHTMPPLIAPRGERGADIVIGDRFGRSCAGKFANLATDISVSRGFKVAVNTPYAGGYILEQHARPASGIHGLQVEISRHLYLDQLLKEPTAQVAAVQSLICDLASAIATEMESGISAQAAE